jgi:hypothetical protein
VGAVERRMGCGFRDWLLVEAAGVLGPGWLRWRRAGYRGHSRALTEPERARLGGFFTGAVLDSARVCTVPRIEDPWTYGLLRALRIKPPMSLGGMAGMAFIDTVVISSGHGLARGDTMVLLFHELVHVVQFRLLGVRGMLRRYIRGWAACGYDYWSIPLEEDAYELHGRFAAEPGRVFSVEDEVRRRLGLGPA